MRSFWALLLLGLSVPGFGDDASSPGSIFLVARRDLPDPNFYNSVVLLSEQGPSGARGVIVNRPTDIPLASVLPDIKKLAALGDKLFFGGPVASHAVIFVFRARAPPKGATEVLQDVYMSSSNALLRELLGREKPTDGLRIFAGFAAWAPGQLESEISRGDWHRIPADAKSIFEKKPQALWQELYQRASATMVRNDFQSGPR